MAGPWPAIAVHCPDPLRLCVLGCQAARQVAKPVKSYARPAQASETIPALSRNCDGPPGPKPGRLLPRSTKSALVGRAIRPGGRARRPPAASPSCPLTREEANDRIPRQQQNARPRGGGRGLGRSRAGRLRQCGRWASTASSPATSSPAAAAGSSFPVTVTTANGPVTIKAKPVRIVSLGPTATEDLYTGSGLARRSWPSTRTPTIRPQRKGQAERADPQPRGDRRYSPEPGHLLPERERPGIRARQARHPGADRAGPRPPWPAPTPRSTKSARPPGTYPGRAARPR